MAENGRLPVVTFTAGGIATPADAALCMQLGADGVFVGSGIFKSGDPDLRAKAIVEATTHFEDPEILARVSQGLGEPMVGISTVVARPGRAARDPRLVTQYYTATSLDGFIAGPGESLEWLFTRSRTGAGRSTTPTSTLRSAPWRWGDDLRMDRRARRVVALRAAVLGLHAPAAGAGVGARRFASGDVAPVHAEMVAAAGGRNRWIVGGGDLAGQFAAAGLLDEVIVYIAPVTLGAGAPLLPRHVELRLEELERNVDFACARYAVVK